MGKEKPGFLTAKAFSNRIKSKGLQKLRWFCQLCQKQCRDENGFKCHMMSESHHRQMLLFDDNKDSVMSEYTRQFMRGYLDILKRQFGGKRTQANVIYQEYIKDKTHVHMNSTKFTTLTGFINCLQKMGLCAVDQTEKGWFIEYVAKDPEKEHREKKKRRLALTEKEEEEAFFDFVSKRRKECFDDENKFEYEELKKDDEEKIVINFMKDTGPLPQPVIAPSLWNACEEKEDEKTKSMHRASTSSSAKISSHKTTILEEIKQEQERLKEKSNRKAYWLHEDIIVKLIDNHLPSELRKKEVHVRKLEDRFTAIVRTVDLIGDVKKNMKVKQEHVMTVLPAVGGRVLVVNGAYRGCKATLVSVDKRHFIAVIKLTSGIYTGTTLTDISYDDISKLFDQS